MLGTTQESGREGVHDMPGTTSESGREMVHGRTGTTSRRGREGVHDMPGTISGSGREGVHDMPGTTSGTTSRKLELRGVTWTVLYTLRLLLCITSILYKKKIIELQYFSCYFATISASPLIQHLDGMHHNLCKC